MATKIRRVTHLKQKVRFKKKRKIRARLEGTQEKPRLSIFRSNRHLYVQLVDDLKGHTLVAGSSAETELKGQKSTGTLVGAQQLGKLIAERALKQKIQEIVFDRSGYLYHGRVKALADAARENGLKF